MSDLRNNRGKSGPFPKIFVVDDEPMLLDFAKTVLEPLGFVVQTFRDPKQALKEFSGEKPALIVTDYAMGEMSGLDLLRECRQICPQQKVLLLSGTVDESVFDDEATKPDLFLAKPYQIRDFVEAVRKLAKT